MCLAVTSMRVPRWVFAFACANKGFGFSKRAFATTSLFLSRKNHEKSFPEKHEKGTGLTIVSANVAGLRAVVRQNDKSKAFQNAVSVVNPDIICIQEHKLQEIHVEELTVC